METLQRHKKLHYESRVQSQLLTHIRLLHTSPNAAMEAKLRTMAKASEEHEEHGHSEGEPEHPTWHTLPLRTSIENQVLPSSVV